MSTKVTATTSSLGASEKLYFAQLIVDTFSKSIENSMCLSKIPIAMAGQTNTFIGYLNDALETLGQDTDTDNSYTTVVPTTDSDTATTTVENTASTVTTTTSSLVSKFNEDCIACGVSIPTLDVNDIFSGMLSQIENFLETLENMFSNLSPSYCHFAYFLSFLCIPDLARIMAMLLARIVQLSGTISIGSLTVSTYISGMLNTVLGTLLNYALSMVNVATSPVTCLLNSIESLLEKLPTEENIASNMSDADYKALFGVDRSTATSSELNAVQQYLDDLQDEYKSVSTLIKGEFELASNLITEASDGIEQTLTDLLGLKNYMECENERTSGTLFENVNTIMELIQLVNLIASLLSKKVSNATVNELCSYSSSSSSSSTSYSTTNPVSVSDIADIIEDVTGGIVDIIENDDGQTVGYILSDTSDSDDNLSIFSCNLAEFMRSNTLDELVSDAIEMNSDVLLDPDGTLKDPEYNSDSIRNVININSVSSSTTSTIIMFTDASEDLDNETIINAINDIYGYNPLQNKSDLNYYSVTNPKTSSSENTVVASNGDNISEITGIIASKELIISDNVISGSSVSKPMQIKCGNINNIKNSLSSILEQIK